MKTTKNIILGLFLIVIGVILAGNALKLFDIDIFFKGWWTLFIIVPAFLGLLSDNDKKGDLIFLIIGILLLLGCNKVIDFDIIWELILPIIIIVIGLSLLFKNTIDKGVSKKIDELNKKANKDNEYAAVFSSQDIKVDDDFEGTNLSAVFGELKLDLSKNKLKKETIINTSCVFGSITIYVPDDVKIIIKSNSIFGSITNKKEANEKASKTIYINGSCVFGGVDIK